MQFIIETDSYPLTKTAPWGHQTDGWNLAKHHRAFMFGYDMGCGKTKSAVDYCNGVGAELVLVICPKAVVTDAWPGGFEDHSARKYKVVTLEKGSVAKKAEQLDRELRLAKATKIPLVIVINLESVWREPLGPSYDLYNKIISTGALAKIPWDVMIVDESQRIKSYKSKVSKFVHKLGKSSKYRLCLSGTFLDDSPIDIYGQYRFLDDTIFGKSFTKFKAEFVEERDCGSFKQIVGFKNLEELNRRIFSIGHRVLKRDVLKYLPPVTHIDVPCELSAKARKIYNQLEDEFVVETADGDLTTDIVMVKLLRLAQITGGYLPLDDDDGKVRDKGTVIDDSKMEQLDNILESTPINEPVVIFVRFTNELSRIKELVASKGRTVAELSGRKSELPEWKNGDFNTIVIQIKSGAAGISLVRSCVGIYYSKGYSLGEFEQSLARQDRPGQTRPVSFYHLMVKNTVDMMIGAALKKKSNVVDYILNLNKKKAA